MTLRKAPVTTLMGRRAIDLPAAIGDDRLQRLPHVLRIMLENVLRSAPADEAAAHGDAIAKWLGTGSSEHELEFRPARVLMHDTTCGPALVDIAGMRDAVAEAGGDPAVLNPILPVNVSTDHSIAVDVFNDAAAIELNMRREAGRNSERFHLTKWAQNQLENVTIHPPGTGILHTINLEQLAKVVREATIDGQPWYIPDTLIGTDSHTPMINALGVLGWGVGGLEAEGVMFGLPVTMRIPDVIGVRLTGSLPDGVMATDLALLVTHELRRRGLSSEFVEFFGPGVSHLSVGDRAVIANMAPEYGAQTAFFGVDHRTLDYLRTTGRPVELVEAVMAYSRRLGLWFDPSASPTYTDVVEIELPSVRVSVAGPTRPQDLRAPAEAFASLGPLLEGRASRPGPVPEAPAAVAAITSCTNTTDPRLTIAAGLLARKAGQRGLRPPEWVKTSFSPGSPAAARYLRRTGLLDDLEAIGFGIVGFGCMTCIGNSGPLTATMETAIKAQDVLPVAVISGNRNFPYRVHPRIEAGFLASPPLVIAYALAGHLGLDILTDRIGTDAAGKDVFLSDLWPRGDEIDQMLALSREADDYPEAFREASSSPAWEAIPAQEGELFQWDAGSTYLRRPPFTRPGRHQRLGRYAAKPLIVVGDDISTDQISPAGAIPADSETGRYLVERGDNPRDLNVYASRRGNFEAMVRGLFTNASVKNLLGKDIPAGSTIDVTSGVVRPLYSVAERYERAGLSTVIVAGERYGQGSSRDWAAKGVALLGIRAVLARSFERIHRTNLIGMGVLPLRLPEAYPPQALGLGPDDTIEIEADAAHLGRQGEVPVSIRRQDGASITFFATAEIETALELKLLEQGGIIPLMLTRALQTAPNAAVQGAIL